MSKPVTLVTKEDIKQLKAFSLIAVSSIAVGAAVAAGAALFCESAMQTCIAYSGEIGCRVALGSFLFIGATKAQTIYNAL